MEEGRRSTEIMTAFYKAYAVSIRNHILQKIDKEKLDLKKLTAEGSAESRKKLDTLFGEYYTRQIAESPLYWCCLFDIGDELLDAALHHLFFNRKDKGKTAKLLRLLEQNDHEMTAEMHKIRTAMDLLWQCRKAFYYRDFVRAKEYGGRYIETFGEQQEVTEIMIQIRCALAGSEEKRRQLEEEVAELLEEQPDNVYFRKVRADLLNDRGDREAARRIYAELMDSCLDGLLLLDVKHRMKAE